MKPLVAAVLTFATASAGAQNLPWTKVFESPESTIYLLADAHAERAGESTPVWYLADRKIGLPISLLNLTTYSSQVQRWEVNCRTRAYRLAGGAYFAEHMGRGKELRTISEREGFEIAPVNPQMNAIFVAACAPQSLKAPTGPQRELLPGAKP